MGYFSYLEYVPLFKKVLIDHNFILFEDERESTKLDYSDILTKYLNEDINENDLLHYLSEVDFSFSDIEEIIYKADSILKDNVTYRRKINDLVNNSLENNSFDTPFIITLSLFYDEFFDLYMDNLFNSKYFPLYTLGIFINLPRCEFMDFINESLKDTVLSVEQFYFLADFIKVFVQFEDIRPLAVTFLECYKLYYSLNKNTYKISSTIYSMLKIDNFFDVGWKNMSDELLKNKKFVLCCITLSLNTFNESESLDYNSIKFKKLFFTLEKFLKYLSYFDIEKDDYYVLLDVYKNIFLKYINLNQENEHKMCRIIKYIINPNINIFDYDNLKNNLEMKIRVIIFYHLVEKNYIDVLKHLTTKYELDFDLIKFVLHLIDYENINFKIILTNKFVDYINEYIYVLDYDEIKEIINHLLWITNNIIKENINIRDIYSVISFILNLSEGRCKNTYNLIKNIIYKKEDKNRFLYFEGESFYEKVKKSDKVMYERIDREYLYSEYLGFNYSNNLDIVNERDSLIYLLNEYFSNDTEDKRHLRDKYYTNLLSTKYFDVYKFDIVEYFSYINDDIISNECDFLIRYAPDEIACKLGVLLSKRINNDRYKEVYEDILYKVNWGDLFFELYNSNKIEIYYDDIINHTSYLFIIKFIFREKFKNRTFNNLEKRNSLFGKEVFKILNTFERKLNSYIFVYNISFCNDEIEKEDSVNILTLKIKTILKILKEALDNNQDFSEFYIRLYVKLKKYIKYYSYDFISFTQICLLNQVYDFLKYKILKIDTIGICHKDIENNNVSNKINQILNGYFKLYSYINKELFSSKVDNYYNNIFYTQNVEIVVKLLNNEKNFYNDVMDLFYKYIKEYNFSVLDDIFLKSIKNPLIAKFFIKLIGYYPDVLLNTIENSKTYNLYMNLLEIT